MTTATFPAPRILAPRRGRSVAAIVAALFVVGGLSHATDQVFHATGVFPPFGQDMAPELYALALAYRTCFGVAGGAIAAALAPSSPLRHAKILGGIGVLLSSLGVIAALTGLPGPLWYPLALVVTAFPTSWLGGAIVARRRV
jgi:hypothetical protein